MSNSAASPTRIDGRRHWYRLHLSSIVLLIPLVGLLTVLIVPGVYWRPNRSMGFDGPFSFEVDAGPCDHGWPWVFLRRDRVWDTSPIATANSLGGSLASPTDGLDVPEEFDSAPSGQDSPGNPVAEGMAADDVGDGPPLLMSDNLSDPQWFTGYAWWGPAESFEWNLPALAGDLALAVSILVAVAAYFEWRRWRRARVWQFSIRELGFVVLLVAVACAWWQVNVRQWRRETAAIEQMREQSESKRDPRAIRLPLPPVGFARDYCGPVWLRRLAGTERIRWLERVTGGYIENWDNCQPHRLDSFERIRSLSVRGGRNMESLADYLRGAPTIREVRITSSAVGDDELRFLRDNDTIIELDVRFSHVTDRGLAHVATLPNLQDISLSDTGVWDGGLSSLSVLSRIKTLNVRYTHVTGAGLAEMARNKGFTALYLDHSDVTDEGLREVARLQSLTILSLYGTKISEEGLKHLKPMRNLETLAIDEQKFSSAALRELKAALPKCFPEPTEDAADAGNPQHSGLQ